MLIINSILKHLFFPPKLKIYKFSLVVLDTMEIMLKTVFEFHPLIEEKFHIIFL